MKTLEDLLKFRTIGTAPIDLERASTGHHIRAVCVNKPRAKPRLKCLQFNARIDAWQITVYKVSGNDVEFEGYAPAAMDEQRADEFRAELNNNPEPIRWTE